MVVGVDTIYDGSRQVRHLAKKLIKQLNYLFMFRIYYGSYLFVFALQLYLYAYSGALLQIEV